MYSGDSKTRSVLRLLGLAEPPLYESGFPVPLQAWYNCRTHSIVSYFGGALSVASQPISLLQHNF